MYSCTPPDCAWLPLVRSHRQAKDADTFGVIARVVLNLKAHSFVCLFTHQCPFLCSSICSASAIASSSSSSSKMHSQWALADVLRSCHLKLIISSKDLPQSRTAARLPCDCSLIPDSKVESTREDSSPKHQGFKASKHTKHTCHHAPQKSGPAE